MNQSGDYVPIDGREMTHRIAELFGDLDGDWGQTDTGESSRLVETVWQIWTLYSEVHNGGLWQYFHNDSGEGVPLICEALREIGAEEIRSIVEVAISALEVNIPWDDEMERQRAALDLPQDVRGRLSDLESQFNRHIDELPILLYHYLLKHRNGFKAPAGFWEGVTIQ
ncbi:MAG: DMP19 family protein [Xanthobacteraceae bacterium]